MVQVPKILPIVMIQRPTLGRPSPICLPLEKGLLVRCSNGKLYAIGGDGLSSVEVFDPSNDSWSAGVSLPSEVNRGTAITVDGKIYLIGGANACQNINQVLCFDPSTSQWSTKANMPTARNGIKLVWFENRIWAIGGLVAFNKWKATIPPQIPGKRKLP